MRVGFGVGVVFMAALVCGGAAKGTDGEPM